MPSDALPNRVRPAPALLIDAKAACAQLSIGRRRLWSLTNCGSIPCHRIGRSVRYSPAELAEWIRAGCPTTPGAGVAIAKEVRR